MRSHVQVWPYHYGPNGVQPLKRSQLGDGCPTYGPDGVNVVYERENYGVNAGQWVKRYLTTDYQGTVLQAHDVNGDHEQHYELFGAEKGQVARRTGWLDREIDWESSPLTDLYRTVDLVNRKYDPQRGVFLTSDPLWMMSADASSYHYAYHDPMNMIDPWGLSGEATNSGNPSAGGDDVGSGGGVDVGPSNKDEQQDPSINWADVFVQDLMRGVYLRGVGVGALPGVGIGGGGLGPLGGSHGGTGKSDVAPSSSQTGTGSDNVASNSKFSNGVNNEKVDGNLNDPVILQGPSDPARRDNAQKPLDGGYGNGGGGPTSVPDNSQLFRRLFEKVWSWFRRTVDEPQKPNLTPSQQRSIRSWQRKIQEHKEKLENYRRDPWSYDNRGHLRANEQNPERIASIIRGRIKALEAEIRKFEKEIQKILEGR